MSEKETFDLIKEKFNNSKKDGLTDIEIFWLINQVEKANNGLHHIEIIASTMEDSKHVSEIYRIADVSQLSID